MMRHVKSALEDADVALLVHDSTQPIENMEAIATLLKLKVPAILLLNKTDLLKDEAVVEALLKTTQEKFPKWEVFPISAQKGANLQRIVPAILKHLPIGPAFYPEDSMSDRPVRFFVSELIRGQIFDLYHEEIPYHTAVIIQSFEEKPTLNVIKAEIIVSRETQKIILLGRKGSLIKELGIRSRRKIEEFLQAKVHLELFVKVRPKWRDNENYLREYGYN